MLVLAGLPPASPSQPAAAVSLAVVRSDGILVPFAVHDGTAWINPWPGPIDAHSAAPGGSLQNVNSYWRQTRTPAPRVWRLRHPNVWPSLEVRLLSHVGFDDHCLRQVGLLTDFRDVTGGAFRKTLASHGVPNVEHPIDIRNIGRDIRFWKDMIDDVRSSFSKLEDEAIARWEADKGRAMPVSARDRAMKPLQLRTLYGDRSGGRRRVYFEAVRDYAVRVHNPDDPDPCHARMHIRGWAVADTGGAPAMVETTAVLTDCHEMTASSLHPLGIVEVAGERLWVVQQLGYESESYALISAGATVRRVLEVPGGGC